MADGRGILKFVKIHLQNQKNHKAILTMKRCALFCYKPMYSKECLSLQFNESKQQIEG
jgi:hypothetical protein